MNNPYQAPMMNNPYIQSQNPYMDRMSFLQNYQQSLQQPVAGTQMSLANQQPMPQQIAGINGRIVQTVESINANEVPMDGSMAFFPKQDIGQITPIVVRNGRAEMKCRTVSDIEPIERQCVYEDNKPCNSSCRYSNTCIHSASKTEE